jgi:hypothetical protein
MLLRGPVVLLVMNCSLGSQKACLQCISSTLIVALVQNRLPVFQIQHFGTGSESLYRRKSYRGTLPAVLWEYPDRSCTSCQFLLRVGAFLTILFLFHHWLFLLPNPVYSSALLLPSLQVPAEDSCNFHVRVCPLALRVRNSILVSCGHVAAGASGRPRCPRHSWSAVPRTLLSPCSSRTSPSPPPSQVLVLQGPIFFLSFAIPRAQLAKLPLLNSL